MIMLYHIYCFLLSYSWITRYMLQYKKARQGTLLESELFCLNINSNSIYMGDSTKGALTSVLENHHGFHIFTELSCRQFPQICPNSLLQTTAFISSMFLLPPTSFLKHPLSFSSSQILGPSLQTFWQRRNLTDQKQPHQSIRSGVYLESNQQWLEK